LAMRSLGSGSLRGFAGEGIARARVANAMRENRANLTRENMTTKAKRRQWERLKAWGVNRTNAEGFYRVFQSEIIQQRLSIEESRAPRRKDRGGTRSGSSMSRTGVSYAEYGHGVKMKQNK
jgi:hypothetical protein